jgi:hypothetical protein
MSTCVALRRAESALPLPYRFKTALAVVALFGAVWRTRYTEGKCEGWSFCLFAEKGRVVVESLCMFHEA